MAITISVGLEIADKIGDWLDAPQSAGGLAGGAIAAESSSPTVAAISQAIRQTYDIKQEDLDKYLREAMPDGKFRGLQTALAMKSIRVPLDLFSAEQVSHGVAVRVVRSQPSYVRETAFIDRPTLGNRIFENTGRLYPRIRRVLGPSLWDMVLVSGLATKNPVVAAIVSRAGVSA